MNANSRLKGGYLHYERNYQISGLGLPMITCPANNRFCSQKATFTSPIMTGTSTSGPICPQRPVPYYPFPV
jgi:hypothetical protein